MQFFWFYNNVSLCLHIYTETFRMTSTNGYNSYFWRVELILRDLKIFCLCAFLHVINSLMTACISFTKINSFLKWYQVECSPNPEIRRTNTSFPLPTVVIRAYSKENYTIMQIPLVLLRNKCQDIFTFSHSIIKIYRNGIAMTI